MLIPIEAMLYVRYTVSPSKCYSTFKVPSGGPDSITWAAFSSSLYHEIYLQVFWPSYCVYSQFLYKFLSHANTALVVWGHLRPCRFPFVVLSSWNWGCPPVCSRWFASKESSGRFEFPFISIRLTKRSSKNESTISSRTRWPASNEPRRRNAEDIHHSVFLIHRTVGGICSGSPLRKRTSLTFGLE